MSAPNSDNVAGLQSLARLASSEQATEYLPEFFYVLQSTDDIGSVVRAHIYTEYWINRMIAGTFDGTFEDKINFAVAKRLVDSDTASCLRALNSLRNQFAHQLDYELTPTRLQAFVSKLRGSIRKMYDKDAELPEVPHRSPEREHLLLRYALCSVYTGVHLAWVDVEFPG